ncbi:hypothetical protein ACNKHW_21190 [Shigella flexneri]
MEQFPGNFPLPASAGICDSASRVDLPSRFFPHQADFLTRIDGGRCVVEQNTDAAADLK